MKILREGENPSAPANLVLPKPVLIPRREMLGKIIVVGAGSGVVLGLEGCPTAYQWVDIALQDLPTIIQIVSVIVAMANSPSVTTQIETQLKSTSDQIIRDLNLAKTLITQYKAKKDPTLLGKIDAALITCENNLSAILTAFHITDETLMTTISASLGVAIASVLAVQALIPPPPASTTARVSLAKENGANAIREAFNLVVGKSYPNRVLPVT